MEDGVEGSSGAREALGCCRRVDISAGIDVVEKKSRELSRTNRRRIDDDRVYPKQDLERRRVHMLSQRYGVRHGFLFRGCFDATVSSASGERKLTNGFRRQAKRISVLNLCDKLLCSIVTLLMALLGLDFEGPPSIVVVY